jgi:hypothetical protein
MAQWSVRSARDCESKATFVNVSHGMGDQNLIFGAPWCFGRHVKLLVLGAFAVVGTHSSFKEG